MKEQILPGSYYIHEIYEWTLRMSIGVWYSIENIKMDKTKFINCIEYLIATGEDIVFNDEMTKFKKILSFEEDQRLFEQKINLMDIPNKNRSISRKDTLFDRAYSESNREKQRLLWSNNKPSIFSNKLL